MSKNQADTIITIKDLVFEYARDEDGQTVRALDGVNLAIERGSFTSVIGRNGSGKSTLAKNINALLLPTSGSVTVDGFDTADPEALWEVRRRVGMVFQNPDNQLVSAVVEDDVAFGPENLGVAADEIRERVRNALDSVDMTDFRKMAPHLLSGGQKQRVAIAGVVAMRPDIIVFDEPTAMLDPSGRGEVMEILAKLNADGVTVVLITHFMEETLDSDSLVIMDEGRIVMQGTPLEIFSRGSEVERLGLRLPFAVRIAERLRERGIAAPKTILTPEALAEWTANAGGEGAAS
jgi:energy-coupling factor transport system ATP-binding protein